MTSLLNGLIQVSWNKPDDLSADHLIGGFCFGCDAPSETGAFMTLDMPVLGESAPSAVESWRSSDPLTHHVQGNIHYSLGRQFVFGVWKGHGTAETESSLADLTSSAYDDIFALLSNIGMTEVWRFWNHFSKINEIQSGLERYRQFNVGRQAAFERHRNILHGRAPAASAVGTRCGPLMIGFLAGKLPATLVENPKQVSAYDYPDIYGPVSPSFSRAAVAPLGDSKLLLISGTASILGHETKNQSDAYAQTMTTLQNIAHVAVSSESALGQPVRVDALFYRAYVRDPIDLVAVERAVADFFKKPVTVHYVEADICRRDLLVEIEAIGYAA